ncbi:hypothetical protein N5D61_02395 [Pseudomonas sp. GD03842]|nr:hypothetical protein [Pseudomonas sp. GD03842]MDH0745194.1 hypothetical protein [Pseudomonas sp. GD03842]
MKFSRFAVGLAFKLGGLVQSIGDGDQLGSVVVPVERAFARAVLKALDLGRVVPPQVFGRVGRIDDGVGQPVVVEVLWPSTSISAMRLP